MMAGFVYSLIGWGAAFANWITEPLDHSYEARKRRQAEARRAMGAELYGPPSFRLVRGDKK